MIKRIKWVTSGVVLAVIALAGGRYVLETRREQAETLRREAVTLRLENEKLQQEREVLTKRAQEAERRRRQLAQVVERLNVERRVATVDVLQQHRDVAGQVLQTIIRLTEMDRDGKPLPAVVFGIPSAVPHFDALVIKFEDDYVARGDQLRGQSLALFRRVYGETQAPEDGYWLGERGQVPDVYRVAPEPSDFELELWREFWTYASDPERARNAGVRVAQGEAVYAPMTTGQRWLLTLEADGGLNLIRQDGSSSPREALDSPASATVRKTSTEGDRRLHVPSPLEDDT